jgi:Tol biopolymer transport system component
MNEQDLIPEHKLTTLLELEAGKIGEDLDLWAAIEKQITTNQGVNIPSPDDYQASELVPETVEPARNVLSFPRMLKYTLGIAAVLAIAFIIGTAIQPDKPTGDKEALSTTPTPILNPGSGVIANVPTTTPNAAPLSVAIKLNLPDLPAAVRGIAWKQDGSQFATATEDGTVNLWSSEGKLIQTYPPANPGAPVGWPTLIGWGEPTGNGDTAPAIISNTKRYPSPDGKLVAWQTGDGEFQLQKPDGSYVGTLSIPTGVFGQLAWSPDGKVIATAGQTAKSAGPGDIRVWLWRPDGTLITTLQDFTYPINSLSWSADSSLLAIAAKGENQAALYSPDGKLVSKIGENYVIWQLAWSPDGQTLAAACDDKTVRLFDRKGTLEAVLTGHQDTVWAVAWSPDGRTLASGSGDKTVKLWTVK